MSVTSNHLKHQLAVDMARVINTQLDRIDAYLMKKGLCAKSMHGDYQNQLFQYKRILSILDGDPCDLKALKLYLEVNPDLFSNLQRLINLISTSMYTESVIIVRETLKSRFNYFHGLTQALPIGRVSYPADVVWFHRRNMTIVTDYLSEHSANTLLFNETTKEVEEQCDFRDFKLGLILKLERALRFLSTRGDLFFVSDNDTHYQADNYFRYHLYERLNVLAHNTANTNVQDYLKAIEGLQARFLLKVGQLIPDNKEESVPLSEDAVKLVQLITRKKLEPLFSQLKDDLVSWSSPTFTYKWK